MNDNKKVNVISFAVWGDSPVYNYGLLENCCIIRERLPNFKVFVFHNDSLPHEIIEALKSLGMIRLKKKSNVSDVKNTMWRFIPAFNKRINICLVRDADSRIGENELYAIAQWLETDKDFHIIRDHVMHRRRIMAGMWGCRNQILVPYKKHFKKFINEYQDNNWIIDEIFLEKIIYPKIVSKAHINASHNRYEKHSVGFPKINPNENYVGCVEEENFDFIRKRFPDLHIPEKMFKRRYG